MYMYMYDCVYVYIGVWGVQSNGKCSVRGVSVCERVAVCRKSVSATQGHRGAINVRLLLLLCVFVSCIVFVCSLCFNVSVMCLMCFSVFVVLLLCICCGCCVFNV